MRRKRLSISAFRRVALYAIVSLFTLATIGQDALAFDKSYAAGNDIEFYEPCPGDGEGDTSADTAVGQYISTKDIPAEGLVVGASVFGGKQDGSGKWVSDLGDNNGNDLGNAGNHLTGTTSFAELTLHGALGDALGNLDNGTKLEIALKSGSKVNKIVAVKGDVGTGGDDVSGSAPTDGIILPPKNKSETKDKAKAGDHVTVGRAVDLWWETANLLGLRDGTAVITVHAVPPDTPVTPLSSKPAAETSASDPNASADSSCCATATNTNGGGLLGSTDQERIWNFLTGADGNIPAGDNLTPEQAAGVMGNIAWESSYKPTAEEGNGVGYGLIQWSYGRRTALEKAAKNKGVKVSDLKFQLEYLYQESKSRAAKTTKGKEWDGLKKQQSIGTSLVYWHDNSERSADTPEQVTTRRGKLAQDAYNKFYSKDTPKPAGGGTAAGSGGGAKPVVFLDPGHGGNIPDYTDSKSGLITNETNNGNEDLDVLDVANRVKSQLEKGGYTVLLSRTKNNMSAAETPKFRERADAAIKAKAGIGVSIHTSPGGPNEAWSQKVGTYRERKDGSHRDTFTNKATASSSQTYAKDIAEARTKAEGHNVGLDLDHSSETASFGRGGNIKSPGNIPLIALWAETVPWVYNEIAQDKGTALSDKTKTAYAKGIVDGIMKALPATGGDGCSDGAPAAGDLAGYILKYAWPDYHSPPYFTMKPDYAQAVKKAQKDGRYVGGLGHPGIDCGGFVTTIMVDSGFEPKYNYGGKTSAGAGITTVQQAWLDKNWTKLGSGANVSVGAGKKQLQQGDVAINADHTFIFAGKIDGFHSNVASASVSFTGASWRTPMAGHESPTDPGFTWYRKK